jgi:predicted nuclease of restriction endonuclease-like RecB superfamily
LLPEEQLPIKVVGQEIVVDFLGADDLPWLRALIEEFESHGGRRERDLRARLAEPSAVLAPVAKRRAAAAVLWRLWRRETRATVPPREARGRLFKAAARCGQPGAGCASHEVLARTAAALAISPSELDQALFADISELRFLLEIVGFWTREYLERKLASLRTAAIPNLILCIDEERNCAESEVPVGARVVRFKRRIDAAQVLAVMNQQAQPGGPTSAWLSSTARGDRPSK